MGPGNFVIFDRSDKIVATNLNKDDAAAIEELIRSRGVCGFSRSRADLLFNVREFSNRRNLTGITLIERAACDVLPPPFTAPFEPIEVFRAEADASGVAPAERPRWSIWPLIVIAIPGIATLLFMNFAPTTTLIFISSGLALSSSVFVRFAQRGTSWIVPGGLWVTRNRPRNGRLMNRNTSTVYVGRSRIPPFEFFIELVAAEHDQGLRVPERAARAFLAAWQSPLPPPDEATIRAYFGGE